MVLAPGRAQDASFAAFDHCRSHAELADLESYHRLLDAYLWLSLKFPANFVQPEVAATFQTTSAAYISDALATLPPPTRRGRAVPARTVTMGTAQRPVSDRQIAKRTATRRQRRRNKEEGVFFD